MDILTKDELNKINEAMNVLKAFIEKNRNRKILSHCIGFRLEINSAKEGFVYKIVKYTICGPYSHDFEGGFASSEGKGKTFEEAYKNLVRRPRISSSYP